MIDAELAAFLKEGVGIQLGTRNERLEPNGVRVVAVAVDPDGSHVVAYVPEIPAARVLADLTSNGQAAIVFGRPPDERACQLKGTFAGARAANDDERDTVLSQWDRWLDRLASVGYARPTFEHWIAWPCMAIRMRVNAIFNQTPGPGAGARVA
jgi:hypothetical protein